MTIRSAVPVVSLGEEFWSIEGSQKTFYFQRTSDGLQALDENLAAGFLAGREALECPSGVCELAIVTVTREGEGFRPRTLLARRPVNLDGRLDEVTWRAWSRLSPDARQPIVGWNLSSSEEADLNGFFEAIQADGNQATSEAEKQLVVGLLMDMASP